ncbi:ATP-binding protein [Bacteroides sp. 224]|uniref:ATP-binding protein n=1 Tax=Bacteroides sp. 224 TaxID=2302936 RepID=UPI0013D77D3E|nr:ATP-binding protein [Bacteroides sp. 224]NDV66862.1 AAA family ATPase [Bacteroides sp. 224]
MNSTPRYPIGIQSFEKLREEGYEYVDKTHHIRKLIELGNPYFLSRPRWFGKSLLLSTIEAYFMGKKELFHGLAIEKWEAPWNVHPVIHLDLNADRYDSCENLLEMLEKQLCRWEEVYETGGKGINHSGRFMAVIEHAYLKTGRRVVVLIDEYDKPLLRSFHDEELQEKFRTILTAFYTVLKTADKWLHFVLITGVTKFAQMGIFSTLNQLKDISFDPRFSDICGMTRPEIEATFQPGLEELCTRHNMTYEQTINELTRRYDGYYFNRFQKEGIYNPFSLLNVLSDGIFENFWFASGTPTFLVEMLKTTDYDLRELEGQEVLVSSLTDDRANVNNPIPMIYQSGYLTIKGYNEEFQTYKLGFPNDEVKYGLLNFAAPFYTYSSDLHTPFYIGKFTQELRHGDISAFLNRMKAFFADIPYELNDETERHYQVIFYLIFKLMGQFAQTEVRSAHGRADAVVWTKDYIYVFEFKLNGTAEDALRQIDEKGYLIPYTADTRQLIKVAVEFDKETRNVGRWLIETQEEDKI